MKSWLIAICAAGLLLVAIPVSAAPAGGMNPEEIRSELERLRTRYTEKYPDVQILERRLKRALELQRHRELEQHRLRQGQPIKAGPEQ